MIQYHIYIICNFKPWGQNQGVTLQVSYFHILRQNNILAEKMANKGVKNKIGEISIKDQILHTHVP